MSPRRASITIAGTSVEAGTRATIDVPVVPLYTHAAMNLPVTVLHGRRDGPVLLVCGAVHGDEIGGVEIARRLIQLRLLKRLKGTLIVVPVVNIYGFIHHSRYLPDRRDLNRSFPGTDKGSLTAYLANLICEEFLDRCTHGIDLHTGSNHRANLPQIRACLDSSETRELALAFRAPIVVDSALRDNSLRAEADERGLPWLTYEGGEALRFDEYSIRAGLKGVVSCMRHLGMLPSIKTTAKTTVPVIARKTTWVRAGGSGILHSAASLGARINKGDTIGVISDPFGLNREPVIASCSGTVIGRLHLPLVHQGDALFHIASLKDEQLDRLDTLIETDYLPV